MVLLFAIIAIFLPASARSQKDTDEVQRQRKLVDKLTADLAQARVAIENLQQQHESDRRNLKSVQTPTCVEVKKATGWLFTTTIQGDNAYEVNGRQYTLSDLLRRYDSDVHRAEKDGCKQRIKVYLGNHVSAKQYDFALRRVEQHFYSLKLGPE